MSFLYSNTGENSAPKLPPPPAPPTSSGNANDPNQAAQTAAQLAAQQQASQGGKASTILTGGSGTGLINPQSSNARRVLLGS